MPRGTQPSDKNETCRKLRTAHSERLTEKSRGREGLRARMVAHSWRPLLATAGIVCVFYSVLARSFSISLAVNFSYAQWHPDVILHHHSALNVRLCARGLAVILMCCPPVARGRLPPLIAARLCAFKALPSAFLRLSPCISIASCG